MEIGVRVPLASRPEVRAWRDVRSTAAGLGGDQ